MKQRKFLMEMAEAAKLRAQYLSSQKNFSGAQREYLEQSAWLGAVGAPEPPTRRIMQQAAAEAIISAELSGFDDSDDPLGFTRHALQRCLTKIQEWNDAEERRLLKTEGEI